MKNKIQLFGLGIALVLFLFVGYQMVSANSNWALDFDGINDYVEVPDNESLNFGTGNFSIEFLMDTSNPSHAWGQEFLGKINSAWENGYTFAIWQPEDIVYLQFYEMDETGGGDEAYDHYTEDFIIEKNELYHIVGIKNGADLSLFVDGVLVSSYDGEIIFDVSNNGNLIFGGLDIPDIFVKLLLDNVRIYNRALSGTEVLEHYAGIYTDETGLVGYWNFNEGTGNTAIDNSGLGNNGIIYGAVYEEIVEPEPEPTGIITAGFEGNMPETAIASTTAFIGDLFSSSGVLIYLFIGIPFAFFIIFEVVGMIKDRKIWAKK